METLERLDALLALAEAEVAASAAMLRLLALELAEVARGTGLEPAATDFGDQRSTS